MKYILKRISPILVAAGFAVCPVHGEDANEDPISYSHEDVAPNLVLISYRINRVQKQGNGVIALMEGKPYLLTNLHIVLGAENLSFITTDGRRLSPKKIELSNGRDLVRLALDEEGLGLPVSTQPKMNMPIAVFTAGNGEEHHVEHGTIIGVGSSKIEISAMFDDSNNGAPALNTKQEIVGIATYSREFRKHAMKSGTRFETDKRHFCSRMGRDDWRPVNWKSFNRSVGKAYRKHEAFCNRIMDIFKDEEYNASASEAEKLSALCRMHVRELEIVCERRDLTDFLMSDFEDKLALLEFADGYFESYAKLRQ